MTPISGRCKNIFQTSSTDFLTYFQYKNYKIWKMEDKNPNSHEEMKKKNQKGQNYILKM
jgi:hypothetical protein